MGTRGAIPKRADQRHGHRKPETPSKATAAKRVPVPRADPGWHEVAKRWYLSLARSGQAIWYEPSDWAVAYLVAESISRDLSEKFVGLTVDGPVMLETPLSGASLTAYLRAMAVLMVTEGDRRRLRIELEREKSAEEAPGVEWIDDARARLRQSG